MCIGYKAPSLARLTNEVFDDALRPDTRWRTRYRDLAGITVEHELHISARAGAALAGLLTTNYPETTQVPPSRAYLIGEVDGRAVRLWSLEKLEGYGGRESFDLLLESSGVLEGQVSQGDRTRGRVRFESYVERGARSLDD